MGDERKIENPWNELKPSETTGHKKNDDDAAAAPKPAERLPEGSYGELNYKEEDSPEGDPDKSAPPRSGSR